MAEYNLFDVLQEIIEFLPDWNRRWEFNDVRSRRIFEKAEILEAKLRAILREQES